jgi:hypothetical protein
MTQEYQPIDREGNFRGKIIEYKPVEGKGKSMNIALRVLVTGMFNDETQAWEDDWEQYAMVAEGMVCIVQKNQQINEYGARGLVEAAGWDGNMMTIWSQTWQPQPISFTVKPDTYNGQTELKIGFINTYDRVPNGGGISEERARAFDAQFSSQFRALASNAARNAPASVPAGRPAAPAPRPAAKRNAPKAAPAKSIDEANAELAGAAATGDEIPF